MKKTLLLAVALLFLLAGNSMAITWSFAGHVFDQNVFDYNNDYSPINYPDVEPDNVPSPGGADGELFDFEGSKFAMDDDYLYFAVTSSFGMNIDYDGFIYDRGDFFFGFNGSNNGFAVDMNDGSLYANTVTPLGIPVTPMGYHNNPAVVAAVGAYEIGAGSQYLGFASGMSHYVDEFVTGDTFVLEMAIAKSFLEDYGVDFNNVIDVSIHETISCGNDVIDHTYNVIPEPGTLALLTLGLLGTGIFSRRKK
jgi:PEP-CTERM motif